MNQSYKWPPYIFAPVQKVKMPLQNYNSIKKIQGFVETLQIMAFQNDW